jgi:Peptidase C80 family
MRYQNQVIIQLQRDRTIHDMCENLVKKHRAESWWGLIVKDNNPPVPEYRGGSGQLRCDQNTRVYFVGHGNGLFPPSISGFGPNELAAIFAGWNPSGVGKIGLVSCYSAGVPESVPLAPGQVSRDFAKDFHIFLRANRIRTVVSGYQAMVSVQPSGRKQTTTVHGQWFVGQAHLKIIYILNQNGDQEAYNGSNYDPMDID